MWRFCCRARGGGGKERESECRKKNQASTHGNVRKIFRDFNWYIKAYMRATCSTSKSGTTHLPRCSTMTTAAAAAAAVTTMASSEIAWYSTVNYEQNAELQQFFETIFAQDQFSNTRVCVVCVCVCITLLIATFSRNWYRKLRFSFHFAFFSVVVVVVQPTNAVVINMFHFCSQFIIIAMQTHRTTLWHFLTTW